MAVKMAARRRLAKAERQEVYNKMGGFCAYCGVPITTKTMQVDHVIPLKKGGADEVSNMLPACGSCNHYKSTLTVEQFRDCIERWPGVLMRDSVTYKNAVRFGVVTPTPRLVTFFFERLKFPLTPPNVLDEIERSVTKKEKECTHESSRTIAVPVLR